MTCLLSIQNCVQSTSFQEDTGSPVCNNILIVVYEWQGKRQQSVSGEGRQEGVLAKDRWEKKKVKVHNQIMQKVPSLKSLILRAGKPGQRLFFLEEENEKAKGKKERPKVIQGEIRAGPAKLALILNKEVDVKEGEAGGSVY